MNDLHRERRYVKLLPVFALTTLLNGYAMTTEHIQLYVGQAHVLNELNVKRIAVGNGKVLQATALDNKQILLLPETAGQSTIHLWTKSGQERAMVVTVLPADATRLVAEVQSLLGNSPNVSARVVGDKVLVEGSDLSEAQSLRLAEISKRYPQVISLASKVGVERMIEMDVRMIEIKRDAIETLGVKWNSNSQGPSFGIVGDIHRSAALRPGGSVSEAAGVPIASRVSPFATALSIASNFTSALNFMVQNGDAVILAEPRLSCRSGGSARFIAGGELPIPQTSNLGQTTVTFKEYGVKFDVSPQVSDTGVIAAKIATEISAINFDVMVKDVPGLTKRRAETEVNLRENETLVIAGLMSDESSRNVDKVAGLGDIPILGKLFRSRAFREHQTDLIVFITPRFVGAGDAKARETQANAVKQIDEATTRVREDSVSALPKNRVKFLD
jgi:pilus assembly protein CpaC